MTINASIKKKWLKALRSGDFAQSTGGLKNDDGYCCLGVLAEVADPEQKTWDTGCVFFGAKTEPYGNSITDGAAQVELLGGRIPPKTMGRLVAMNDDAGLTFNEIADYIEKSKRI